MSIFKKDISKKTRVQAAIIGIVIVVFIALVVLDYIFGGPITHLLTNKDEVVALVRSKGIFGPLIFVILQAVQTIAAPIPGAISGTVGGYLFGWWGILWTALGATIGFAVIFWISRKFGRRFVEKIIKKESLAKFDYLTKEKGTFIFFMIFLIPGLPDDVVGYIAGLTTIPIRKLLALVVIGRMPAVIMTNMFGAGLGEDTIYPVVIIATISALLFVVLFLKRDAIMRYLESPKKNKHG